MARAKKCEEEFNPWPPFVDVFSSVVLVLLLFILVLIVNVAYYMQYNSKANTQAPKSTSQVDSLSKGVDVTDMVTLKKEKKMAQDVAGNDSLFSGGSSEGNAMSIIKDEKIVEQNIKKTKESEITVEFKNQSIFLTSKAKESIKAFIKKARSKNKSAKFEISVTKPNNILGKTMPKQISMGRALGTKNAMKKMGLKLSDMKLSFKKTSAKSKEFGAITIKVIK
jgi:hypothetical protein